MLYQQGDVLIETVETIPEGVMAVERQGGRHILAEGEATGHAHAVLDKSVSLFENSAKELFLSASKKFTVTHEEHKNVTIPKGDYKIRRVKEYDHFEEEARVVRD